MVRLVIQGIFSLLLSVFISLETYANDAAIEPTFAGVKAAIQAYEAEHLGETLTISAILARLPHKFRSGYTLMYESQSIQDAEFSKPRVIMYGDDATTVMAFNGDAGQLGFERLEFASLNPTTQQLEFSMIEFPIGDTGFGQAKASGPNPELCKGCHGQTHSHYIWGQYARWPGAYGSRDDILEMTPGEKAHYLDLLSSSSSHPRYQYLVREFAHFTPVAPYRTMRPETGQGEHGGYELGIEQRTNFRFGALAMRNQARSRAYQVIQSPLHEQLKHGFAFVLAGCGRYNSADAAAIFQHDQLRSFQDYATSLGSDPKLDWHLERGSSGGTPFTYYAGLNHILSAFQAIYWPLSFRQEPDLMQFFRTSRFGDVVRQDKKYRFKISDRGQELWDTLDRQAPILTTFNGSSEADAYIVQAGLPHISEADAKAMCHILVRKQLAKPAIKPVNRI